MTRYRDLSALLEANTGSRRLSLVFDDFVEMAALAVRNAVDHQARDQREERYRRIAQQYSGEQLKRFSQALALVTLEMESEPCDVLGRLFMELDLGNQRLGQFYTPYDLARLIAGMTVDRHTITSQIARDGFVTVHEPACGAGAFLIALCDQVQQAGANPQTQLHVTAEDVAAEAVHMAYIHLSLLHIPAVVHHRNSLTRESVDSWATPAHILGGWSGRLQRRSPSDPNTGPTTHVDGTGPRMNDRRPPAHSSTPPTVIHPDLLVPRKGRR